MNTEYVNNKIDVAKALTKLDIENAEQALALFDDVIKIIEKFDGLLLNKRLDTALHKLDYRLNMKQSRSWFEIYFADYQNRSVEVNGRTRYTDYHRINLVSYLDYQDTSYGKKGALNEENRIIASVIVEELNKEKENIAKMIEDLKQSLRQDYTEHFKRKKEIEDLIAKHNDNLPRHLVDDLRHTRY